MSNSTSDFAALLREATKQARANAPRAVDDLRRCASEAAAAVADVTGGAAALELVPINQGETTQPAYQLQLRRIGSEAPASDLGVYSLGPAGYPVQRWYSRNAWGDRPEKPDQEYANVNDVEGHYKWMISKPDSLSGNPSSPY